MKTNFILLLGSFFMFQASLISQQYTNTRAYQQDKKNGGVLSNYQANYNISTATVQTQGTANRSGSCDCYVAPDATYTRDSGLSNTDDGNSVMVNLPFTFCFYGTNYTQAYINANGNISFGAAESTFSSNPFPDSNFVMIAPFWADVDTRGFGDIYYKITPNALYVNWVNVGYYDSYTDKLNTFQVIISDGTLTSIGTDNNVAFCYKDMQWTTGDASNGSNGFGGTPSTVGANKGDGTNYIQFTRSDQAGGAYDGPFNNNDGVDWLDNQTLKFNTCVVSNNIPPIGLGVNNCDTITVCSDAEYEVFFMAPENGQITTVAADVTNAPNFNVVSTNDALIGSLKGSFTSSLNAITINEVTFTATDNGTPPQSTDIDVVFRVLGAEVDFDAVPANFRNWEDVQSQFLDRTVVSQIDSITGWSWSFGNGNTATTQNPYHTFLDSGYFDVSLTVNTEAGCVVSRTKRFTSLPEILPPNVISPNGDGLNDVYSIKGLHFYQNVNIAIYNRWGYLVYENSDYKGDWGGTNNSGTKLSPGTYYYIITNEEFVEDMKGTIQIFE